MSSQEAASHRNSPLRVIQGLIEKPIGGAISPTFETLYNLGLMKYTVLSDKIDNHEDLDADTLTITGLQLVIRAAKVTLEGNRPFMAFVDYKLGWAMDAFDGMLARHNGTTPEGGMKDVSCDRLAEFAIVDMICDKLDSNLTSPEELKLSFVLSTLTKATSEMYGIKSSEGGSAGMIVRRKTLDKTMHNIQSSKKTEALNRLLLLRDNSYEVTGERIRNLLDYNTTMLAWDERMYDKNSSAASEAKKYATIVLLCEREGIDAVSRLNAFTGKNVFPTLQELRGRYKYIETATNNISPFLENVTQLVNSEMQNDYYAEN